MIRKIPNQYNDLNKLFDALTIANELINNDVSLTDKNYGMELTIKGIHKPKNENLTIEEYFQEQERKPSSGNRGHYSVARGIKEFFELLGLMNVDEDRDVTLTPIANQLLEAETEETRKEIWKNAVLQLTLVSDGEISHPYRILLKLVNTFPSIETSKLMLALEAENDSEEEFERISNLVELTCEEIINHIGTSQNIAKNAVKVLPAIAEQLGDIRRIRKGGESRTYPTVNYIITEDEIVTEEPAETTRRTAPIRRVTSEEIAQTPNFQDAPSPNINPTEANRIRQRRILEHQEIVRLLAQINEEQGFELFEGRFDCLAVKNNIALLYEVKTILESFVDQEKQTIKAIGQLKYYKFSEVRRKMGFANIKEILVFSQKPHQVILEFCSAENTIVIWRDENNIYSNIGEEFNPDDLLN